MTFNVCVCEAGEVSFVSLVLNMDTENPFVPLEQEEEEEEAVSMCSWKSAASSDTRLEKIQNI